MPYRIAAPPEPEPPEVEDPYVAVLRAQRRRARLFGVIVVVLAVTGLARARTRKPAPRKAFTETTRTDVARGAITKARVRAAAVQARFDAELRAAVHGDLGPRVDLGACPLALSAPSPLTAGRPAFPLLVVDHTDLSGPLPSQAVADVLADVRRAEAHVASGRYEEAALYARALDRPERFGHEVVLVTASTREPRALSGSEYEPGELEGRAYLYDFSTGRVVCAGDVKATSSKSIGYVFSDRQDTPAWLGPRARMGEAIRADIRMQTERAIAEAMRWRAGPP